MSTQCFRWPQNAEPALKDLSGCKHTTQLGRNGCGLTVRLIRDSEGGYLVMVTPTHSNAVELVCSADEAQSMNLTTREVEILRWVECGMANADNRGDHPAGNVTAIEPLGSDTVNVVPASADELT